MIHDRLEKFYVEFFPFITIVCNTFFKKIIGLLYTGFRPTGIIQFHGFTIVKYRDLPYVFNTLGTQISCNDTAGSFKAVPGHDVTIFPVNGIGQKIAQRIDHRVPPVDFHALEYMGMVSQYHGCACIYKSAALLYLGRRRDPEPLFAPVRGYNNMVHLCAQVLDVFFQVHHIHRGEPAACICCKSFCAGGIGCTSQKSDLYPSGFHDRWFHCFLSVDTCADKRDSQCCQGVLNRLKPFFKAVKHMVVTQGDHIKACVG